jgi:hypothetical protein
MAFCQKVSLRQARILAFSASTLLRNCFAWSSAWISDEFQHHCAHPCDGARSILHATNPSPSTLRPFVSVSVAAEQ